MTPEQIAAGLKHQITMDAHRLALMPQDAREAYEMEWRAILEQDHG